MAVRAAIALLLLAVLPLVLAAEGKHSVIVIADPGVDDAGALLLALASPSIHLLGVVSSFGGHPDPRLTARNAQRLIEAAGREADVPVIVGGIIPDEDARKLKAAGVARVYTPKDFEITQIMADIVDLVDGLSREAA